MKAFFKFSGLIAAALAIVAIILMMATPSLSAVVNDKTYNVTGIAALFGADVIASGNGWSVNLGHINAGWTATVSWILALVAVIALLVVTILPLLKIKALDKFAGIIALCAACCLLVAGILVFFTQPAMDAANTTKTALGDVRVLKDYGLGVGYVFVAILDIVAGACAVCPMVANLIKK